MIFCTLLGKKMGYAGEVPEADEHEQPENNKKKGKK